MPLNDNELSALTSRVRRSLNELEAAAQHPQLAVMPAAEPPIDLPAELQGKWENWKEFFKALCTQLGFLNRDQYLWTTGVAAVLAILGEGGGAPGPPGATPNIGPNGNWWIAGIDTGVKAQATSPYVGPNGNWWTNGTDTGTGAAGTDGATPYIGPNGNWWIAGVDTGIAAAGKTPYVGPNGNWFTNGTDSGVGGRPFIGANGNWWIGVTDTGVAAQGPAGEPGQGLKILGRFNTEAELRAAHPTGQTGDAYLVGDDLYMWFDLDWVNLGPISAGIGEAPDTGSLYMRDGLNHTWELLTVVDGGIF